MIEQKCIICNKIYKVKPCDIKRGSKYCSQECYHKSKITGEFRKCLYCDKEIYIKKYKVKNDSVGKYCSKDCFTNDRKNKTKLQQVNCHYCDKIIYRWRKDIKRSNNHYCSMECKNNDQKNKIPYNKGIGGVLVKCINCGKTIKVAQIRIKRGIKFCSNKCKYKYQIGENSPMFGDKSPSWKGGLTSSYLMIRKYFKYRQWRSDIFTRDDFTCQICGDDKGGNLNAHHIKPFLFILQKYEITKLEEALECEELWNINNGITVCKKCHNKLHIKTNNKIEDKELIQNEIELSAGVV